MKTSCRHAFSLGVVCALALLLVPSWASSPSVTSGTATASASVVSSPSGQTGGSGGENTDPFGPATTRYGTPEEADQSDLSPLPEVRYAVVPLRALLQAGPDNTGTDVRGISLNDQGGVIFSYRLQSNPQTGAGIATSYWSPTGGTQTVRGQDNLGSQPIGLGDFDSWTWPLGNSFSWWRATGTSVIAPLPALAQLSPTGQFATSLWAGQVTGNGAYGTSPGSQAALWSLAGSQFLSASGPVGFYDIRWNDGGPAWPNGPYDLFRGSEWGGLESEAVGVNRHGHAIVREREVWSEEETDWWHVITGENPPGYVLYYNDNESWGTDIRILAGRIYDGAGGRDLLGRLTQQTDWYAQEPAASNGSLVHDRTFTQSTTITGQTLDPRYLNDLDMVAGYRVTSAGGVPEAGVLTGTGSAAWFPLPTPSGGLVLAGLTSGYADGGRAALPVAYGWENIAPAGQPADLRPWVAHPAITGADTASVSATWTKRPLKVADPATRKALRPTIPTDGTPPVWRINDRMEMVFGDHRVVRNGRVLDLNKLVPRSWHINSATDINRSGTILAQVFGPMTTIASDGTATTVFVEQPALLLPFSAHVAADANGDGIIGSPGDADRTSEAKPFTFWVNSDIDRMHYEGGSLSGYEEDEEDDIGPDETEDEDWAEDWQSDTAIVSVRDLEDFARLRLDLGELAAAVAEGKFRVGLKWKDNSGYAPAIKVWRNLSLGGGTDYLTSATIAQQHVTTLANPGLVQGSTAYIIPEQYWQDVGLSATQPYGHLLFEGCLPGKRQLVVTLHAPNGAEIGEGGGVWIELKEPGQLVERYTVGEESGGDVSGSVQRNELSGPEFPTPQTDEEKDYVLYVHGYNMSQHEKQRWIETIHKRLHWLGYKGRVGGFSWPCTAGFPDQAFFDQSEHRAWQSAVRLKELLADLKNRGYRVHVLGHSQGNIVVTEALRLWRMAGNSTALVSTYVASQAAVPAGVFNANAPLMSDYDDDTPDVYARYWRSADDDRRPETWPASNPPYMPDYMASAAGRWANFYNLLDFALTGNNLTPGSGYHPGWEIDQRQKPNEFLSSWYFYGYGSSFGFRRYGAVTSSDLRFPGDRYEIFSYGAGAWSVALGTIPTGGVFSVFTNLGTSFQYGDEHIWHSGQFRGNFAERRHYWVAFLDAALIPHLNP
jgi:hypothetical protein